MYTVLIADDEQVIRSGLQKYILWNQIGFTCIGTASNGSDTIQAIVQQQPDVVLCDIRMPIVSGLDVARYVYENKLHTIVVLHSAYRDFEYARTAMAYNVRYYVVKSARHTELIDTFHKSNKSWTTGRNRCPATISCCSRSSNTLAAICKQQHWNPRRLLLAVIHPASVSISVSSPACFFHSI